MASIDRTDYRLLVDEGAVVVDVRSLGEFNEGHISGSVNIPLEELSFRFDELEDKLVITCCKSGKQSEMAVHILSGYGIDAINGGAWNELEKRLGYQLIK